MNVTQRFDSRQTGGTYAIEPIIKTLCHGKYPALTVILAGQRLLGSVSAADGTICMLDTAAKPRKPGNSGSPDTIWPTKESTEQRNSLRSWHTYTVTSPETFR